MAAALDQLKAYKEAGNLGEFNKILIKFLPNLKEVVSLKIKQFERNGWIPRNMYSPQEIVDEIYLKIFENFSEEWTDPSKLKVEMFLLAGKVLDEIKEKHQGKKISFEKFYRDELKELEEEYTVDADGDLVMIEELDDISYHLDEYKDRILLLDAEQTDELLKGLDIEEETGGESRQEISRAYSKLPELSQSVINHYVFGKLTKEEVAKVHGLPVDVITEIIEKVKIRLKGLL
jgi:DNA-directed RNA polymerase specialized sigma24 family protein